MRHRNRARNLKDRGLGKGFEQYPEPANWDNASAEQVEAHFAMTEAWRLYGSYPDNPKDIMPTRLGNVLRRYEILAGARYGLDAITIVPRLLQVADSRDVAYVQNQRIQMELALRTAVLALAATTLTVLFMWRHGPWLLLSLVPYAVAFVSYRGAVVIAREYGTALAVLIDLNRFALYERMHLPPPEDIEEERENNARLNDVMRLDNVEVKKRLRQSAFLDYVQPAPTVTIEPSSPEPGSTDRD